MFKPAPMVKVRAIVLKEYVEDVLREFSRLGSMQIKDVKEEVKDLTPDINEKTIEQCSSFLKRIYYLIDVLDISEEKDIFGSLKYTPEKISLERKKSAEYLNDIENSLSDIEAMVIPVVDRLEELNEELTLLKREKFELECFAGMSVQISWLKDSEFLYTVSGIMEDKERLMELLQDVKDEFILKVGDGKEGRIPIVISTLKENRDKIDYALSCVEFERFTAENGNLEIVNSRIADIENEEKSLKEKLANAGKYSNDVLAMREIIQLEKDIAELGHMMGKTASVSVLEGWVPRKRADELLITIEVSAKGHSIAEIINPSDGEIVPTYLDNSKILKPFEVITETFGIPAYKELDPTPLMAFTFPLFFGLMFGDAGQGIILILLGLAVAYLARKSRSVKSLGLIVIACGIFATFFGFMYGDLFGVGPEEQKKVFGSIILERLWVNPMSNPTDFLSIALYVGIIHVGIGLIMKFINKISERDIRGALLEPLPRLWFYYGSVAVVMIYGLNINEWISNIHILAITSFVPLAIILLTEIIKHLPHVSPKKIVGLLSEGGFEVFDTLLIALSNTISYSRIFALALVHAGLFMALFAIAEMLMEIPSVGIGIYLLVIILGTIVIMALESLIVFLHSLRLHYYEWFSKFFKANGVKYQPFRAERVYTSVVIRSGE